MQLTISPALTLAAIIGLILLELARNGRGIFAMQQCTKTPRSATLVPLCTAWIADPNWTPLGPSPTAIPAALASGVDVIFARMIG